MSNRPNGPTGYLAACFLLGLTITISISQAAGQSPSSLPSQPVGMHVHVYDYAPMPASVLAGAEQQVDMILLAAGVNVTWEVSTPPTDPSKAKPTSPRPLHAASVELRIVPRFDPKAGFLRYDAMGFAVSPETVTVSLAWVEKLASLGIAEEYQVLGVAMAHEIGHLFLGPNSHSPSGIMRAGWKEDDLLKASQARLTFTPDEARRIRTEVRHRQVPPL